MVKCFVLPGSFYYRTVLCYRAVLHYKVVLCYRAVLCCVTKLCCVTEPFCVVLQSCEVRSVVAEGLAKLLLSGRVVSAKLLSRLVLIWYNPVTEDDTLLRHCLGAFFPIYAFASV